MTGSLTVKRQILVKTIITENFKKKAENELLDEVKLVDEQLNHLQAQLNQFYQQLQQGVSFKLTVSPQEAEQIISELNLKIQQLIALKQNLQLQIDNIQHSNEGDIIVTGSLENFVEIKTGDNIYEMLVDKEILVKDGIIQEIST